MSRALSFRGHLVLLGLVVAVPFIAAGGVISARYVQSQVAATEEQVARVAEDVSRGIDRQLESAITSLRVLSLSGSLAAGDLRGFHEQARKTAELLPGSIVALRTSAGVQLVISALPFGTPLSQTRDPILLEADARALASNAPVISDLYMGATVGKPFVIVEFPVSFADERMLLSAAIPPESIRELLTGWSVMPGWRMVVVDRRHTIVARTVNHEQFVGRPASREFAARLTAQRGTLYSTTLDGVPVVNGYVRSDLSGWTTIVSVDREVFDQSLRQALVAVVVIGVIGFLASLLFAFAYSHFLVPRIWRLRDEASKLAIPQVVAPFSTGIRELNAVSEALASSSQVLEGQREANQLLINELNHRVKNTLATVQAIATQTLRQAQVDPKVGAALEARLLSLSKTHNLLTRENWSGGNLQDVVEQALGAYAGSAQIRFNGPAVRLPTRAAIGLAMGLHELATNAVKYGALSTPAGTVNLSWTVADGTLQLLWQERGGPPVQPPERRGFGTRLLERSLAHDLNGPVSLRFDKEGLSCQMTAPLADDLRTEDKRDAT
jgi:two-component sensor histidine kinase